MQVDLERFKYWQEVASSIHEMSFAEYRDKGGQLIEEQPFFRSALEKLTIRQLKDLYPYYSYHDKKKPEWVDTLAVYLLNEWNVSNVSYSNGMKVSTGMVDFSDRRSPAERNAQEIMDLSEEDFYKWAESQKEYLEERRKEAERNEKAMTNPETYEDFKIFVRRLGVDLLNDRQLRTYDRFVALEERERTIEQKQRQQTITAPDLDDDIEFTVVPSKHTKTGEDIWVVTMSSRAAPDQFRNLRSVVKRFNGYYSRFAGGFVFKQEDKAQAFAAIQHGDVESRDVKEDLRRSSLSSSERLIELAEDWEAKAKERKDQPRKTNTARRARMAAGVEADMEEKIYTAKVIRKIAEANKRGDLEILDSIRYATDVETLLGLIRAGKIEAAQKWTQENPNADWREKEKHSHDQMSNEDGIRALTYPYPFALANWFFQKAEELEKVRGRKREAQRLEKIGKQLNSKGKHGIYLKDEDLIATLKEDHSWRTKRYEVCQRLGLKSTHSLRTALWELNDAVEGVTALSPEEEAEKKRKLKLREFQNHKVPGFFPTPTDLAESIVENAGLEKGMRVLEPSAGIGHIARQIIEQEPDVDLVCVEQLYPAAEFLENEGFEVHRGDFLEWKSSAPFDRIIMNPPFEHDQDIKHLDHAYTMLKPGGVLIAIMAANKVEGSNRRLRKEFIEEVGDQRYSSQIKMNEENAFKSAFRPTGVSTITVTIEKPETEPTGEHLITSLKNKSSMNLDQANVVLEDFANKIFMLFPEFVGSYEESNQEERKNLLAQMVATIPPGARRNQFESALEAKGIGLDQYVEDVMVKDPRNPSNGYNSKQEDFINNLVNWADEATYHEILREATENGGFNEMEAREMLQKRGIEEVHPYSPRKDPTQFPFQVEFLNAQKNHSRDVRFFKDRGEAERFVKGTFERITGDEVVRNPQYRNPTDTNQTTKKTENDNDQESEAEALAVALELELQLIEL